MQQEEHDTQTWILRALRFRPKGMTITDVAKQIGATRNSASKHLEILQIAGKVEVRSIGNAKLYSLAQRVPMSAFLCFTRNLILILDSSLRIVQANDQCLKTLQRTKDELVGLTLEEAALPIVSTPEAIAVIEGLEREQVVTDLRYRSDGKDLFFQMQAIPTTFDDGEKGATLVLEDITEQKRYVRDMEFLARTAMELVDLPAEADIYQYIGEQIMELVPGAQVFVDSYDEVNRQFLMQAILDQTFREGLKQLVGQDVVGMTFRIDDIIGAPHYDTVSSVFMMHEHVFGPQARAGDWSFHDLCFRQIPEKVCDEILAQFNIGKTIGIELDLAGTSSSASSASSSRPTGARGPAGGRFVRPPGLHRPRPAADRRAAPPQRTPVPGRHRLIPRCCDHHREQRPLLLPQPGVHRSLRVYAHRYPHRTRVVPEGLPRRCIPP